MEEKTTKTKPEPGTRRVVTTREVIDGDDEDLQLNEKDTADIKKIEDILQSNDLTGGTIRMERKGPFESNYAYLTKIESNLFDMEMIKKVYGGGDYRCKTFRANGQMYKSFTFSIDPRIKGSMDIQPQQPANGSGMDKQLLTHVLQTQPQKAPDNTPLLVEMMKTTSKQGQDQMLMMVTMIQEGNKQMTAMMAGMFQAMATIGANKPQDSMVTMLPLLLEIIKSKGEGKGADLPALITAMKELKELTTGESSGPEKEETTFDKIAKYAAPVLTALITKTPLQMPGVAPMPSEAPALAEGTPPQPQPVTQPQPVMTHEQREAERIRQQISPFISMMMVSARGNKPVDSWVGMIFDHLDDEQLHQLVEMLRLDTWLSMISNDAPEVKQHEAWFTKLRDALINEYDTTLEPETAGGETVNLGPVNDDPLS